MVEFFIICLLFVYSFSLSPQFSDENEIDVSKFKVASSTDQIIVVIPPYYTSTDAMLYFYIKKDNKWNLHTRTEAYIGKNGLGKEREGDNKTPIGVYQFNRYFGIEDNPGTNLPYVKVNESHYWDGDSNSSRYNTLVNNETYKDFNASDSEHLIEYNPGYEYALNIDYNKEQTPKKGAGIFLHCFTDRQHTAGCVAINKEKLKNIYKEVNENCYIIINTKENMTQYYYDSKFINLGLIMLACLILCL